jgi:hypothetical protein
MTNLLFINLIIINVLYVRIELLPRQVYWFFEGKKNNDAIMVNSDKCIDSQ